jgi:hypothetical protein
MELQNKIVSHFKNVFKSYSDQLKKSFPQIPSNTTSNLDPKKIHDLMLLQYSKTLLDKFQQELEHAYTRKRDKEKTVKIHTDKHREIVQKMHDITENINKISDELSNLTNTSDHIITKIKNDLKLHPYKP